MVSVGCWYTGKNHFISPILGSWLLCIAAIILPSAVNELREKINSQLKWIVNKSNKYIS